MHTRIAEDRTILIYILQKMAYLKRVLGSMILAAIAYPCAAEDSTSRKIQISAFLETYYGSDFARPADHNRPGFIYTYHRDNEVNINLGFVKFSMENKNVRSALALMTGTYSNANLASEPGVLKNIFEAHGGVKLSDKKEFWIDAGVMPSHIGFESAHSPDCWNLSRSMMADNSPYYETGIKLSYTTENKKWFFAGFLLNGWQHIQRPAGQSMPAFGHQITWNPNERVTLNSSSFVGSETPDSNRLMRYFHNIYGQFLFHDKLGMIMGFDIGIQQKNKGSKDYNTWYTPVVILRYTPSEKFRMACRWEYYYDKNEVIIRTGTANGFQTMGLSVNADRRINENAIWRTEVRNFRSRDQIFYDNNQPSISNTALLTSLIFDF